MKDKIALHIDTINRAIAWIKANKPEQYEQRFLQLVAERCRLRKLAETTGENPAIAAYGESQKGKSYVITNMLSSADGQPFKVDSPKGSLDFVKQINPITNNVEATGVVTRFTTFGHCPERYDEQFPVLIKLLRVSEVATILCDGYHSDITDYRSYSDDELKEISAAISERYATAPEQPDPAVTEDDILDMKYYLTHCTGGNTQSLTRSPYFDRVALVARRIPADEWAEVFSPLWHKNATLTALFTRLADSLRRLGYAKEVYLPIDAVDNQHLTLMSVQRINELGKQDGSNPDAFTDVAIRRGGAQPTIIHNYDKSELSALCAEAVFKVDERYLDAELNFDLTMVDDPAVRSKLSGKPFKKDILRHTDLLDFPGARARNQLKEENLSKTDDKNRMSNDANVYLRGKVAFLFNRYSDSGLINILLFCHDNAQRNDDNLYLTIENWVRRYVGDSPEQRRRTLDIAGGVSPFFLIATKFNIDMTMDGDADSVANTATSISQRWADRFNVVLYKEVLHAHNEEWFQHWISEGETFKNTYLLRDYKYSGNTGKGNNLYIGFAETGREQQSAMPQAYYERMRRSFIESEHTQKFFADPALSWDAAATLGNDGALLLFQRLSVVASHMESTRRNLSQATLRAVGKSLYDILKGYYHSDDASQQLLEDIARACAIRREIIFACNRDNYFFGRMMQNLQTTEKQLYNAIYDVVQSPDLNAGVNDFRNYELIRKDLGARLDRCSADNDNAQKWECLVNAYNFPDREAAEAYLAKRGVDPHALFAGNLKRKTNSVAIAERVYDSWIASVKTPESINRLTDNGAFDPIEMTALVDNIELTSRAVGLPDTLEALIADYVNIMNINTIDVSFIADVMASAINDFVSDLGLSRRTPEQISAARRIADENPTRLDPFTHLDEEGREDLSHEELTELFNRLNANPVAVTPAFERNYYRWIELMIVSFLLKGKVIDYDIAANTRMGELLQALSQSA